MKNTLILATVSGMIATGAFAQATTFTNENASADAVEAIEEQVMEQREDDMQVFGNEGREIGNYGSLSLSGTTVSNDGASTTDLGIGLRYGMFDGVNGIDVTAALAYGEANDEETKNTLLAGLDYRRELSNSLFGFGKLEAVFDNLADQPGDYTRDIFVGAGIGYRIYNENDLQWSVQAGPGYRVAKVVGEDDLEEAAVSVSSNLFYGLSDASYVTNDTDIIYSESGTTVVNELALNVAVTEVLSLRTSYTNAFNDATDDTFSDGVNTFGVSAIYNFN